MLGLVTIQPATEILNHKFYQRHPRMIIASHIHLWLGRSLLIAGAVQGGLGFLFASSFRNAVVDTWPRVLYAATALVVWIIYVLVGILYPEFKGSIKEKIKQNRTQVVAAGEMENLRVGSVVSGGNVQGHLGHMGHTRGPSSAPLMDASTHNVSTYNGYQGNVYQGSVYEGSMYQGR